MNVSSTHPVQTNANQVQHTPFPPRPHADDPGVVTQNAERNSQHTTNNTNVATTFQNAHTRSGTRVDRHA